MRRLGLLLLSAALASAAGTTYAQMAPADARAEGEAIAEGVRDATSSSILSDGAPTNVPTYGGTDLPQNDYADDVPGLDSAGASAQYNEDYQVVVDPYRTTFDPATIDLSSAQAIEGDPDTYLGPGTTIDGTAGTCEPLPETGGGSLTYLESCNAGSQPFDEARQCSAALNVNVTGSLDYLHECQGFGIIPINGGPNWCPDLQADALGQGISCTFESSRPGPIICLQGTPDNCAEPEPTSIDTYSCSGPVTGWTSVERNTLSIAGENVDETICQNTTGGADCALTEEICTAPNETRVINGLPVTRACWEWERTYQCQGVNPANDCSDLDSRPECSFSHDDCLSYDTDGVTCNVYDRWYQCTTPDAGPEQPPAYVCADDLYCIDGECTQVEREASTEFKDAMVAMNVMGELRDEFDPNQLKIFSGENLKCTKKLFGLSNCCSGKGVPLLTPWLCNSQDRDVDKKDDEGLCYYVGTYCSNKILGVCTTKKQSYCCYGSKLVRILNEEGKAQLGMDWGEPKEPDCEGFLIEQFQQLDLSQMDFSEVYAEFVDAAKLPDEIEMSIQIQQKIEAYYDLHGGGG